MRWLVKSFPKLDPVLVSERIPSGPLYVSCSPPAGITTSILLISSNLGILLDQAEFATVPDPLETMVPPGEGMEFLERTNKYC
jgi:hypothetical protein